MTDESSDDGGLHANDPSQVEERIPSSTELLGASNLEPQVDAVVRDALVDAAKRAAAMPDVRFAIDQAIRANRTGLIGLGQSAIESAASKALTDVAKQAAAKPDVQAAIDQALRRNRTGLLGLGTSAIDAAVDRALTDVARSAASSPDVQAAVSRAMQSRGNDKTFATDPAVKLELDKHTHEVPDDGKPAEDDARAIERLIPIDGDFSPHFSGPGSFFAAHEVSIDSFAALTKEIGALTVKNPSLKFVWRGQQDANWGLHSSLYRRLMAHRSLQAQRGSGPAEDGQPFPDETAMLNAELAILNEAADWRMTDVTALELFARLQHHGGPTRLLDVTRNPLIAAWFAVEAGINDDSDGRLFALATAPAPGGNQVQAGDPLLSEILASKRYPFWSGYNSPELRSTAEWGTGARRRLWVPPAYDARIAAQNAAFLLEGVPMLTRRNLRFFEDSSGSQWNVSDVAASMSIYARPTNPRQKARATQARLAPLFSFRIEAGAKAEIRDMLTHSYGYTTSLLYPDIQGMSNRLRDTSSWLNVSNDLEQ